MANSSRDSNTVPSPSTPTPSSERRAIPPAFSSPLANRFSPQLTPTAKISLTDSFHHVGINTPPPLPPSSLPSSSSSPALSSSSLLPVSTSDGKNAVGSPYQILNGSTEASTSATSLHGSQSPDITSVPMLYKQNNSRTNSPAQFNTPPGPPVFGSPSGPLLLHSVPCRLRRSPVGLPTSRKSHSHPRPGLEFCCPHRRCQLLIQTERQSHKLMLLTTWTKQAWLQRHRTFFSLHTR